MRRDARLHGLSSDHHAALRFAHRLTSELEHGAQLDRLAAEAKERFTRELLPHFEIEERLLLPALSSAGEPSVAERTRHEHDQLRMLMDSALAGDRMALASFADLLDRHVRFEERELFPACEARLDPGVLDAVSAAAPKHR